VTARVRFTSTSQVLRSRQPQPGSQRPAAPAAAAATAQLARRTTRRHARRPAQLPQSGRRWPCGRARHAAQPRLAAALRRRASAPPSALWRTQAACSPCLSAELRALPPDRLTGRPAALLCLWRRRSLHKDALLKAHRHRCIFEYPQLRRSPGRWRWEARTAAGACPFFQRTCPPPVQRARSSSAPSRPPPPTSSARCAGLCCLPAVSVLRTVARSVSAGGSMSLHGLHRTLTVRASAARARGLCGFLLNALVQPLWREVDVCP